MEPTQVLVFVLVAAIMGWYAAGVIFNIRRGNAVLKWLQAGLPRLGERTTLRWLGSSAVALEIARARPPFRRVEVLLVLEPRDVPWFWLIARARGRRDVLIVRGQLASAPQHEFDWLQPGSWSERERGGRATGREWPREALEGLSYRAPAPQSVLGRPAALAALAAAREIQPEVWQLSTRREQPHLELHLPLPHPRQADAGRFVDRLRHLAEQLSRRGGD
jgi:hypothetical protein